MKYTYTESLKQADAKVREYMNRVGAHDIDVIEIIPRTLRVRPVDWKSERKGKRKIWRVRFYLEVSRSDGTRHWVHQTLNTDRYLTRAN